MTDEWSFEPIKIKDEKDARMICYYDDFKKLRQKLIEDIKNSTVEVKHKIDVDTGESTTVFNFHNKLIKQINKRFGVE